MTVKNFIKTSRFHLNVLSGGDDNVNGGVKYAFCFFFFFFFFFFFAGGQTCSFCGEGTLNLDVRTIHLGCLTLVVSVLY